jgi:hypothetical protein
MTARGREEAARLSRAAARASLRALVCSPARRATSCRSAIMALDTSLFIVGPPSFSRVTVHQDHLWSSGRGDRESGAQLREFCLPMKALVIA